MGAWGKSRRADWGGDGQWGAGALCFLDISLSFPIDISDIY